MGLRVLAPEPSTCSETIYTLRFRVYRVTLALKVCRIIAFYRFWAIILPSFEVLGRGNREA